MTSHADFGKKRNDQPNEENEPEPASQTARLTDEIGIAIRNYDCGAHQAKHATRCANGRTNLWMPAVNDKNRNARAKHAAKINRCGHWHSHALFQEAADPENQRCINEQVSQIEMQKRIGNEAPILPMQFTVVGKSP